MHTSMFTFVSFLGLCSMMGLNSMSAWAEEPESEEAEDVDFNDYITGDWGGARASLLKNGVDIQWVHTSDVLSNVQGGNSQRTRWMGFNDVQLNVDLDKLVGWQNTTALFNLQNVFGSKVNKNTVDSFGGVNNNEVLVNTTQIYQAWLQHTWLNDRLSLMGGVIAVDTEFYVTNSTRVFIQPGYGVGNEFGQTGLNGPPIYPFGTLGARVKYVFPNTEYYVQGAVTDGVPSHPRFQHGTRLQLNDGDGTFNLVEVGYTPSPTPSGAGTSNEGADNTSPPQNYMHKTAFGL